MNKFIGSIMLVSGTSIGIGMLTLPAFLSNYGLFYGIVITVLVWAIMLGSSLSFAGLVWHMPIGTNMLNLSEKTLGVVGKILVCTTYILLLYSLSSAYLSSLLAITKYILPHSLEWVSVTFWTTILAYMLNNKFDILDIVNRMLMFLMIVSFCMMVLGLSNTASSITQVTFSGNYLNGTVIRLLITSFGYQIIVPSLHKKLGVGSTKPIKKAILIGSLIPLIFYLLWFLVMTNHLDSKSFSSMISSGQPVALLPEYLSKVLGLFWVKPLCMILVCAAIGTSWLGVSLSVFDFYKDSASKKYSLLLTLMPPMIFVQFFPNGFLFALKYSGYLVSILLVIMPCLMFLAFQYKHEISEKFISKFWLFIVMLFGIYALFL